MKNKLSEFELVELDTNELYQTGGGFVLLLLGSLGSYMLVNIAANPNASYKAFMNGWNSF
jgi:hypothetical protein